MDRRRAILLPIAALLLAGAAAAQPPTLSQCIDYRDYLQRAGFLDVGGWALDVAAFGSLACIAASDTGLVVVDIGVPEAPRIVGRVDTPGRACAVATSGNLAYVADFNQGLQIIDLTDPAEPRLRGRVTTPSYAFGVAVSGTHAYVMDRLAGMIVVDITYPDAPRMVARLDTPGSLSGHDVAVVGRYAYIADDINGLQVVDIGNPLVPVILGTVALGGSADGVVIAGHHAYVADEWGGLKIVDVSDPQSPFLACDMDSIGWAYGVAIRDDRAYVGCGDGGLRVIEITDPPAAHVVGQIGPMGACKVEVIGDFACVCAIGGLYLVDISHPFSPHPTSVARDPYVFGFDIAVSGGIACLAQGEFGVQLLDVSNAARPLPRGRLATAGYVGHVAIAGATAWAAAGEAGLLAIDISDSDDPRLLGAAILAGDACEAIVAGSLAFVSCGEAGLQVLDVSDPRAPRPLGAVGNLGYAAGVALRGAFAFIAAGDTGLVVVDIADPSAPRVVGVADTPGWARQVTVAGGHAYIADVGGGLCIVDVRDPAHPVPVAQVPLTVDAIDVAIDGHHALVAAEETGRTRIHITLAIVEIADPRRPSIIADLFLPRSINGVVIAEDCIYLPSRYSGLMVMPRQCDEPLAAQLAAFGVARRGAEALVHWEATTADDLGGFHIWREAAGSARVRLTREPLRGQAAFDFTDSAPPAGSADYWLQVLGTDGTATWHGPARLDAVGAAPALRLARNHPNPFNPQTTIAFTVPSAGPVRLGVYDVSGRCVRTLVDGPVAAGDHEQVWNGRDDAGREVASGAYLAKLTSGFQVDSLTMVLLR